MATSTETEPESVKNTRLEIARQYLRKTARERQRLLVHQPAEHHMRHDLELALHRFADMRMIVAVAGGPPRRDAIDEFAPIGEMDARAFGPHHRQRRRRGLHLRIRQPDVFEAGRVPVALVEHASYTCMARRPRRSINCLSRSAAGFGVVSSFGP